MTTATPEPEIPEELTIPETPTPPTLPTELETEPVVVEGVAEETVETTATDDVTETVTEVEEVIPVAPEAPVIPVAAAPEPNITPPAPLAPPAPTAATTVYVAASKPTVTADGQPISSKSRLIAVLLCFFLGALGIHSFYAGKNTNGILQIVITVFTLGTLGWVWPLIDFIMLLIGSYKDSEHKLILNWEA